MRLISSLTGRKRIATGASRNACSSKLFRNGTVSPETGLGLERKDKMQFQLKFFEPFPTL
jgi:hypothetical protein